MKLLHPQGYVYRPERFVTFDDVLLVPQLSDIDTRSAVDLSTQLGQIKLDIPIIAANMSTVCGVNMTVAMGKLGGLGILHRFMSIDDQAKAIKQISRELEGRPFGFSVGLEDWEERLIKSIDACKGQSNIAITVDIAHGHMQKAIEVSKQIKNKFPMYTLIVGNIATRKAAVDYMMIGATVVKIGIGPGSLCTTRLVAGVGIPQLSAIDSIYDELSNYDSPPHIIADGGVRYSGDAVKALAVGANAVMLGRLLAGTLEAEGDIANGMKYYRGMASKSAQLEFKGISKTPEGEETKVPVIGSIKDFIEDFVGGIKSGCSYLGAKNLSELRDKALFVEVSQATQAENRPHGKV